MLYLPDFIEPNNIREGLINVLKKYAKGPFFEKGDGDPEFFSELKKISETAFLKPEVRSFCWLKYIEVCSRLNHRQLSGNIGKVKIEVKKAIDVFETLYLKTKNKSYYLSWSLALSLNADALLAEARLPTCGDDVGSRLFLAATHLEQALDKKPNAVLNDTEINLYKHIKNKCHLYMFHLALADRRFDEAKEQCNKIIRYFGADPDQILHDLSVDNPTLFRPYIITAIRHRAKLKLLENFPELPKLSIVNEVIKITSNCIKLRCDSIGVKKEIDVAVTSQLKNDLFFLWLTLIAKHKNIAETKRQFEIIGDAKKHLPKKMRDQLDTDIELTTRNWEKTGILTFTRQLIHNKQQPYLEITPLSDNQLSNHNRRHKVQVSQTTGDQDAVYRKITEISDLIKALNIAGFEYATLPKKLLSDIEECNSLHNENKYIACFSLIANKQIIKRLTDLLSQKQSPSKNQTTHVRSSDVSSSVNDKPTPKPKKKHKKNVTQKPLSKKEQRDKEDNEVLEKAVKENAGQKKTEGNSPWSAWFFKMVNGDSVSSADEPSVTLKNGAK